MNLISCIVLSFPSSRNQGFCKLRRHSIRLSLLSVLGPRCPSTCSCLVSLTRMLLRLVNVHFTSRFCTLIQYMRSYSSACLPHYTSGQTYFYPAFNASRTEDAIKFAHEFGEVLAMPIMLEAVMRVRASKSTMLFVTFGIAEVLTLYLSYHRFAYGVVPW